ncbi:Ig-like domain-containing protein [Aeromicrobium sp. UC242_57]|uniref:Ig-like domain-containing protein n=1 Tax=Aeromicrobium sp. UC242_57 TaxID=3374624 RepID=UPI0037943A8B
MIAGPADVPNLGDAVDLGVTVSPVAPAKGVPSGQVRFFQGGVAIPGGVVTLDGAGQAVLTTTKLKVGTADITAQYLGDTEFNPSDDTTSLVDFVVNAGDVSITLSAEHDTVISGEKSKFAVKVASLTGSTTKPTGNVQLYVDDQPLGVSQAINPNTGVTTFVLEVPVTNPNGHHHIRAVYEGDSNYNEAISSWIDHVVNFGDAKIKPTSDVNPSLVGNDVTFSIDVDGLLPTKPYEPTGDVQLYVNGTPFNAPIAIDTDGKATVTTDVLPVGTIDVGAEYLGDDRYKPVFSNVLDQVVNKQTATVTLTPSSDQLQYGQPLTLTAKVTSADPDGKATGHVQFYDHGSPVGSQVLIDDNGNATVTSTKVAKGVHQFSAKYLGDDNNVEGVSPTVVVTVNENTLKFRLVTDKIPAFQGEDILLHAKLQADAGSKGKIAGSVQFYNNGRKVGAPVPVNSQGWGSVVVRKLKPGTHRFTARFIPSSASSFESTTSAGIIQRVLKGKPNAKVKMSVRRTGETTGKLRVKVRQSKGGAALGRVQVYVDGRPVSLLSLPSNGGVREFTLTGLADRSVFVTASYRGNGKLRQASKTLKLRQY